MVFGEFTELQRRFCGLQVKNTLWPWKSFLISAQVSRLSGVLACFQNTFFTSFVKGVEESGSLKEPPSPST